MTLCSDPTKGLLQPNPHTAMLFSPFGCIYQPTSPVPPFLLILNQFPKEIAGSNITNCLTHTADLTHSLALSGKSGLRLRVRVYGMSQNCPYDLQKPVLRVPTCTSDRMSQWFPMNNIRVVLAN